METTNKKTFKFASLVLVAMLFSTTGFTKTMNLQGKVKYHYSQKVWTLTKSIGKNPVLINNKTSIITGVLTKEILKGTDSLSSQNNFICGVLSDYYQKSAIVENKNDYCVVKVVDDGSDTITHQIILPSFIKYKNERTDISHTVTFTYSKKDIKKATSIITNFEKGVRNESK